MTHTTGWNYPGAATRTGDTGGGQAHSNLQPYVTCYMWRRTV